MNPSFTPLLFDVTQTYLYGDTLRVRLLTGTDTLRPSGGTSFVYVQEGSVMVHERWLLSAGMYAAVTSGLIQGLTSGTKAVIITDRNYKALPVAGGPIEKRGRLRYIDGCTDSLLVPPVKKGDPCLNHLHFPPGIFQTMHTHPSVRIGIVTRGSGLCHTPFGTMVLSEGMAFAIQPANGEKAKAVDGSMQDVGLHCFQTERESMDVIAFHPDSDTGPTDEDHPMINRTIVDGISASQIKSIQTGVEAVA